MARHRKITPERTTARIKAALDVTVDLSPADLASAVAALPEFPGSSITISDEAGNILNSQWYEWQFLSNDRVVPLVTRSLMARGAIELGYAPGHNAPTRTFTGFEQGVNRNPHPDLEEGLLLADPVPYPYSPEKKYTSLLGFKATHMGRLANNLTEYGLENFGSKSSRTSKFFQDFTHTLLLGPSSAS